MSEYKRILSVNQMSEVLPWGPSFPKEAPPFHGARNTQEISRIQNPEARALATVMVDLCMRLQQRSISLAREGDVVPLQAPVDPDLIKHVIGDSFGMNPDNVTFLDIKDTGKLTLPVAILADGNAVDALKKFVRNDQNQVIISPFALDVGVKTLATELNAGYGQEWPYKPTIVPDGVVWRHPEGKWSLWQANSKARNYQLAKEIDPSWTPKGDIAPSYQEAGRQVGEMLLDQELQEVGVKADINVDGMGNLRFKRGEKDQLIVIYEGDQETLNIDPREREQLAKIVEHYCKKHGIFINQEHPATVQEWEKFIFGLTPSVEIYIPPRETGISPFIINECTQIIENGAFVGSVNPDPLTVSLERLDEIPQAYWGNLGVSREQFKLEHRRGYLQAWEKQRKLAVEFGRKKQAQGEVGHRDYDFGIIVEEDGTYNPRICESNARRTGTWVADTIGRRIWGNQYMQKGYVLTVDNINGPVFDTNFRTVHSTFAKTGALFIPENRTGIILNGHIRNGTKSRILTTIVSPRLTDVWSGYKLTQQVASQ